MNALQTLKNSTPSLSVNRTQAQPYFDLVAQGKAFVYRETVTEIEFCYRAKYEEITLKNCRAWRQGDDWHLDFANMDAVVHFQTAITKVEDYSGVKEYRLIKTHQVTFTFRLNYTLVSFTVKDYGNIKELVKKYLTWGIEWLYQEAAAKLRSELVNSGLDYREITTAELKAVSSAHLLEESIYKWQIIHLLKLKNSGQ